LIVQEPFQSIDSICLHIDGKELTLELLFEIDPGSDRKDAGVYLLAKEVLGLSCSLPLFEEGEGPEDFFLVAAELLQDVMTLRSNSGCNTQVKTRG